MNGVPQAYMALSIINMIFFIICFAFLVYFLNNKFNFLYSSLQSLNQSEAKNDQRIKHVEQGVAENKESVSGLEKRVQVLEQQREHNFAKDLYGGKKN